MKMPDREEKLSPTLGGLSRFTGGLDRRSILSRMAMATGVLYSPAVFGYRAGGQAQPETVVANTLYGRVRGARENGVIVFKGIPYAGSPALERIIENIDAQARFADMI
jgi:hypothetical protein